MTAPELDKIPAAEQEEFLRLRCIPPHEYTPEEWERWKYFATKIDDARYEFEERREKAKSPLDALLYVTERNPYKLATIFGKLELPDMLVPEEFRTSPGDDYHADLVFATFTADLNTGTITSFTFKEYLRRATPEELASVPGLESLPLGEWPKREF